MVIRKNIALEPQHLNKLKPLLQKNDNNLSAAVRDAIDFADSAINQFGTLKEAKTHLIETKRELSHLEETIQSGRNVVISYPTLLWFLKYSRGILMDRAILEEVLDPLNIETISELDKKMNELCQEFGWQIKVSLFSMDNLEPESVTLMVSDGSEALREFVALHIAQFFAYKLNLDVENVHLRATSMRVDFRKIELNTRFRGLENYFGYNNQVVNELLRKPTFWRTLIRVHMVTNYNIVSMGRDNFADILANKPFKNTSTIESFVEKHIFDIPFQEFLGTIKLLHENMGLVEKIEYSDMETIKIYHGYKDEDAIRRLTDFYLYLLESNGHHCSAKCSASLVILEGIRDR
ncbi:MAG: hypothetical protein SCH39_11735 [Methanosarcinales archaeon]|nr:hypothetical protein [ANME-2 cluster archaeon]MDW7776985.1 hypothetical protein [Methanosarcinales archaeon]